jgi:dTDP-4-amino-4,6-dideoxygalactose transaminase
LKVPLLDLASQYRKIRKEVLREVAKVCDSQHYVLGCNVTALEEEIAAYCGAKYAVGVGSGTDALLLALMASGVGRGDRVITTPFTFFSTAGSISRLGAIPVFIDIDPRTYNMDVDALERLLKRGRRGIKGIIPVHLFGQCASMERIRALARERGIMVIEDAAQSLGAEFKGRRAGALGDFGCFSFYPTKNLGCFGDGGMVTTGNARLAKSLKMLRVHGANPRVGYHYDAVGICSRLDELQAAVLRVKLKYLDGWSGERRRNAERYNQLFKGEGLEAVTPPHVGQRYLPVYNQYVIRVPRRDALRAHLQAMGVGTGIYYPMPLHLQRCFKDLGYSKGDLPVSEKASREVLALPIYPELRRKEQAYVVASIAAFYNKRR